MNETAWPALPLAAWKDTRDTIHMYTQMVGKIKLALSPEEPEWAHTALFVTARGLTTGPMPLDERTLQIDFDFLAHRLAIHTCDGDTRTLELRPRSVADFYKELMALLHELNVDVTISPIPQEVPNPIPFDKDTMHSSYDAEYVRRFFRALSSIEAAFQQHRAPYRGRHTPIQLFWGGFDLAYSRYSGLPADPPPKANLIMRKAMDAQEIYAGFWPGDDRFPEAAFASYTYPRPANIESAAVKPAGAAWNEKMGLFVLRYEDVRTADSPRDVLRAFLSSTYEAGAKLAGWDRSRLE
ncbi:MAG TPA: DUF5996 family protein [Candidatus Eremiobacteraceae bacterium]|nr:DUF5996 family protein [Candidatus Eremiobacteraceae bacterium]